MESKNLKEKKKKESWDILFQLPPVTDEETKAEDSVQGRESKS